MATVIDVVVEDEAGVSRAVHELHDWWFDVDAIEWQEASKQLRVPFCEKSKFLRGKEYDRWLVVNGVSAVRTQDTEKVGYYDLNTLALRGKTIVLECGVPLRIEIDVDWPA